MVTQRAYKFRIYPNTEQRQRLAREFGCARCVWNKALELRSTAWTADQTQHNYVSLNRVVTVWKTEAATAFLKEATASCLTQLLIRHYRNRV